MRRSRPEARYTWSVGESTEHPLVEHLASSLLDARVEADGVDPARMTSERAAFRASAVALLLRPAHDELELLLIRRAEREGDVWSGHVGLPGGRAESDDRDVIHTAARETREELSIDVDTLRTRLLGALPSMEPRIAHVPRLSVHPFVWFVDDEDVRPEPNDEVAAFRWVPLSYLRSADNEVEHRLVDPAGVERVFPAVRLGEDVLWGITHRIVTDLFEAIDG